MPANNTQTPEPGKLCRKCKTFQPMRNFKTPKHRECVNCKLQRITKQAWYAVHAATATVAAANVRGITSTREGLRYYERQRKRDQAPERDPPLRPLDNRWCRGCHSQKPASEFASYRHRVCLRCDLPPPRQAK